MSVENLRPLCVEGNLDAYAKLVQIANNEHSRPEDRTAAHNLLLLFSKTFGDQIRGKEAVDYLLHHGSAGQLRSVFLNSPCYTEPVGITPLHTLFGPDFPRRKPHNPFLFTDPKTRGYIGGARVIVSDERSCYQMYVYSPEGVILRTFPFDPHFKYQKYKTGKGIGLEDIRVIPAAHGKFVAVCTTMNTHPESMRMSLFTFCLHRDQKGIVDRLKTCRTLTPLTGYGDESPQKNWSPFWKDGELHLVYSYTPMVVLRAERNPSGFTGRVFLAYKEKIPRFTPKTRGNTPPIRVKGAWWVVVHYTLSAEGQYVHRFLEFNDEFRICRASDLFYFERPGTIEFAISMILRDDTLFLSYGIKDSVARISSIPVETVDKKLREVRPYEPMDLDLQA